VHGSDTGQSTLTDTARFAEESLRAIWRWYLRYFGNSANNDAGVEAIEDELVAPTGLLLERSRP
jgi:hypothetical protein